MPRFDLTSLPPVDPRTRWRCPCGYEGNYHEVTGHRHGWKKRPECGGKIVQLRDPSEDTEDDTTEATPEAQVGQEPRQVQEHQEPPQSPAPQPPLEATSEPPITQIYEYLGSEEELPEQAAADPETIAKMLTARLGLDAAGIGGNGHGEIEGDLLIENRPGGVSLQRVKQIIEVPPVFLVYYDFFKDEGWHQGDGSIQAWVVDFVLDHIRHCLGWRVVVVNEEEVRIVEQVRAE